MCFRYACDVRVIRLMRERGVGNSATRLYKQLQEQHSEQWLKQVARYLTECEGFVAMPGLQITAFQRPPTPPCVPTYKWLLSVYAQDILERLDEVKARITSVYGSVLKLDSTKKVNY